MTITNSYILDVLIKSGCVNDYDFILDSDEIDLNDERVIEALSHVTTLDFGIRDIKNIYSEEDGYEQLCALVEKCPNLKIFRFFAANKEKVDEKLLKLLLNNKNIEFIFMYRPGIDSNYLFNNLDKLPENAKVSIDRIDEEQQEQKFLLLPKNIRKKINISNFSNDIFSRIYNCQRLDLVDADLYFNSPEFFESSTEFTMVVGNLSELNLEQLEHLKKDPRIKGIYIKCGHEEHTIYSIDEYEKILRTVNELISEIKMPSKDDPNREKIIFSQIYKKLGERIKYDHYAVSEEGKKDEQLRVECRNLKNGLLGVEREGKIENLCVCAGYATILQNVCSVLGIECDYISSVQKDEEEFHDFVIGVDVTSGHAYNSVVLDGQAYFCDLTWDSELLRANGTARYFLKSFDDFKKSHSKTGFAEENLTIISQKGDYIHELDRNKYSRSLSDEEVAKLLLQEVAERVEEMKNIGYLGGFVVEYIDFIKQCKKRIELGDYKRILNTVMILENYILSEEFKRRANKPNIALAASVTAINKFGKEEEKDIRFYDPSKTVEEAITEVEEMMKHGR